MNILFRLLTPNTPTAPCNDTLVNLTDYNVRVRANDDEFIVDDGSTNVVSQATWAALYDSVSPNTGTVTNNVGKEIAFSAYAGTDLLGKKYITVAFDMPNVWEWIDLRFEFSATGYNSYDKVIRVFGYDLGYAAVSINTPKFDFVLIPTANEMPYAGLIAYRQPYTDRIYYYTNHSSIYTSLVTSNVTDSETYSQEDGIICDGDAVSLSQIVTLLNSSLVLNTCTLTPFDVAAHVWLPTFSLDTGCDSCNDDCVNIFDTPTATVDIDFGDITDVYIDSIGGLPGTNNGKKLELWLGVRVEVTDVSGTVISKEVQVLEVVKTVATPSTWVVTYEDGTTTTSDVVTLTFDELGLPEVGDYIVTACIDILGYETPSYIGETVLYGTDIVNSAGTLEFAFYKVIHSAIDFSTAYAAGEVNVWGYPTGSIGDLAEGDLIYINSNNATAGATADSWDARAKVIQVYTENSFSGGEVVGDRQWDVPLGRYYKVLESDTGQLNVKGQAKVEFDCFYLALPDDLYFGEPDDGGDQIAETFPIVTCCLSEAITACDKYRITKGDCNTYTVENRSFDSIIVEIDKLETAGWTSIDSTTYPYTLSGGTDLDVDLGDDGVYQFTITIAGVEYIHIHFAFCSIETCYLNYLKKIICCNPEGNCDDCLDDDCKQKNYYDFNAFSILMNTYFALVNYVVDFDYVYDSITTAKLAELYDIDATMTRALEYCATCNEPCTNC